MDFDIFIGRFHPIMVHLPIGFIVLAIILELVGLSLKRRRYLFRKAVLSSLIASIFGSIFSVVTGLLLANESDYDIASLNQHKWLGIAVLVLSVVAYVLKRYVKIYHWKKSIIASTFLFTIVSFTGHLGGGLTHGEDYLIQYAPEYIKNIMGVEAAQSKIDFRQISADSVKLYPHIIKPIFEQKCVSCHNPSKSTGGLDLTSYSQLFEKAESGIPIIRGDLVKSELFKRLSLPVSSEKFMPPKGKPLDYIELNIVKYWIEQGADSLAPFDIDKMNPELVDLIARDYGLDYRSRPYYDKVVVDKIGAPILEMIRGHGYAVNYLSDTNFLLDVEFVDKSKAITDKQLSQLDKIIDNITFLDLSNSNLSDYQMSFISKIKHLTKLDLHANKVSDRGMKALTRLNHLEVLNLYDTEITDKGLEAILSIPSLKRVYVWKTKVTAKFIEKVSQGSEIEIISGELLK